MCILSICITIALDDRGMSRHCTYRCTPDKTGTLTSMDIEGYRDWLNDMIVINKVSKCPLKITIGLYSFMIFICIHIVSIIPGEDIRHDHAHMTLNRVKVTNEKTCNLTLKNFNLPHNSQRFWPKIFILGTDVPQGKDDMTKLTLLDMTFKGVKVTHDKNFNQT